MPNYNLASVSNIEAKFTPTIVQDVVKHIGVVMESGGRLRTMQKREGISKAFHGAKIALGMKSTWKNLYLSHPDKEVKTGEFKGWLFIDDLVLKPYVKKNWKVYYNIVLAGREADQKDRLKVGHLGRRLNEVLVDISGETISVYMPMSGVAFLKMVAALGGRTAAWRDTLKNQMTEKWGSFGTLYGNPGKSGPGTQDDEGYVLMRYHNGRMVNHTGGLEGEWIALNPLEDIYAGKR